MPKGENECSEKNYDGKDAHGAQYGADPWDGQANGMGESSMVLAMRKLLSLGWSLQMIVKNVGVSAVNLARALR